MNEPYEAASAELRNAFDAIGSSIGNYNPISLLSQLTATFLFVPDEFQGEASEVVNWQRKIEFLAGFMLVRPYPAGPRLAVDGSVLQNIDDLMTRYFIAVDRHLLFGRSGGTDEKSMLLARARLESFHVRGDAYPHQFYAFAQELYGPHDAWFLEREGFTIADAIELSKAIDREYGDRFNRSVAWARSQAHVEADKLIADAQASESEKLELERRIFCVLHFGLAEDLLAFTLDDVSKFSQVPMRTAERFLARMSQGFGYRNPLFLSSFTDAAAAPWDFNTLNERPLVTHDGKYWLFVAPLLRSALFNTFYFDLLDDDTYRPRFQKSLGSYVEAKTAHCLRRVFPEKMTLLNPLYQNGEEIADVMVLHDHKILLFQCKAKTLTYRARIGADFDALRNDVQKAIADSFRQGIRARDYFQANDLSTFTVGKRKLALDMKQVNGFYLICVTSMSFQTIAPRSNSVLGLFAKNEYPWSLSLSDLDIITQVLSSPAQFIHYLLRRRQVEATPFQVQADEMDYLGFYLSHGMNFDLDDFKGMDDIGLSGFSDDVDRWVFEKFELGRKGNIQQGISVDGFSDFLAAIERTGDDYATDAALVLVDLGRGGRKSFMEMVEQTKERTRQDEALHSFSVVLKRGKRGLSFLSFDANLDRATLFKQAAAFAMMKKYESKCDEWAGFGWDIASARAVDVAFFTSGLWAHDEQMDQLVKESLRPGRRIET
jgi:hypothetical protein